MRYRPLGDTGMKVSAFCLGTMMFGAWGNPDHDESIAIIHRALDGGINFVDTADVYSRGESEEILGKALVGRRDSVILATKAHHPMGDDPNERGSSRRWIIHEVEASLRRLRTDWIDLYQIHRPDPDTDIEETLSALSDLVHAGKVRAIGSSTFPAEQIVAARWAADRRNLVPFRCEQPPYSLFARGIESAVLPTCIEYQMGVLTWGPLSAGWLTGRYRGVGDLDLSGGRAGRTPARFDPQIPENRRKIELVKALGVLAEEAGISLTHLALAFCVAHPAVSAAIIGPRTTEQLDDLLAGAGVELDDGVMDAIDAIVPPGSWVSGADAGWVAPVLADAGRRRRPLGRRAAS